MALQINRTFAARTNGSASEVSLTENAPLGDFTKWIRVATGGDGNGVQAVLNASVINENWIDCEVTTGGTGRSILDEGVAIVSGKTYLLVLEVVGASGLTTPCLRFSTLGDFSEIYPVSGEALANVAGFYGIVATASTTGTTLVRLGISATGGFETGPATLSIRNISKLEIDDIDSAPIVFSQYLENGFQGNAGGAVTNAVNLSTHNRTTGEIVYTYGSTPPLTLLSNGFYVGDSYYDGKTTRVPYYTTQASGNLVLIGRTEGGKKSSDFLLWMPDIISQDGYNKSGDPQEFFLVHGSVNSITSADTSTQILADQEDMRDLIVAAGLIPMFCSTIFVDVYTDPAQITKCTEVNDGTRALMAETAGAIYVDFGLTDIQDPLNEFLINPLYRHDTYPVDQTHLNDAGYQVLATEIAANLAIVTGSPTLITPYPDLTFLAGQSLNIDLNPNISGDTSLVVDVTPELQGGLSESSGIISGTAVVPTGTATVTVTGTNSFGSVRDRFQLTTLTTGSPTSGINVPINEA